MTSRIMQCRERMRRHRLEGRSGIRAWREKGIDDLRSGELRRGVSCRETDREETGRSDEARRSKNIFKLNLNTVASKENRS
jgi:hypothetical protein